MTDSKTTFGGPVAVSLSGGGGRAAAFHLGVLSYLDHLDLLREVSILSSVSGGTFTAAKYALTLKTAPEGEDRHVTFRRFFDDFYEFLANNLVPHALAHLTEKHPASPLKRRTLVKALADYYDDETCFMNRERFGRFFGGKDIHLKAIIFNSTECKDGRSFRFQISEKPHRIGNPYVWIEKEHAQHIRMADIVAASSDIPVGLEPLLFPQDFVWPKDRPEVWREILDSLKASKGFEGTLPLMDGGVIDNQGIESVLLAARGEQAQMPLTNPKAMAKWFRTLIPSVAKLGLFIISDTPQLSKDIYQPDVNVSLKSLTTTQSDHVHPVELATPRGVGHWTTLGRINVLLWILLGLSGLIALEVIGHAILLGPPYGGPGWTLDAFFYATSTLLLSAGLFGLLAGLRLATHLFYKKHVHGIAPNLWSHLRLVTLNDLIYMITMRISSTWALTGTIFLNRIRRLMYYAVYSIRVDTDAGEVDTDKPGAVVKPTPVDPPQLLPNEIYELTLDHTLSPELQPSEKMRHIAKCASDTQTTLWLSEKQRRHLVVCGQITTCFNLIRHLEGLDGKTALEPLYAKLRSDWESLREDDPCVVLREYTNDGRNCD